MDPPVEPEDDEDRNQKPEIRNPSFRRTPESSRESELDTVFQRYDAAFLAIAS